ncbi:MAG: hypothetical protein H6735_33820 [Alphaproteobacteria bacterium]|nr:hypothetical protein [Alphaproteobacteria bacterium]
MTTRRDLLRAAALALTVPAFVADAFGATRSSSSLDGLMSAYRAAQKGGRPLLVLVIPDDDGQRYAHGRLLGAFLNHADDAHLATLALATVVCATPTELAELVPGTAVAADSWALVVETDAVPATTAVFGGEGPPPEKVLVRGADWEAEDKAEDLALQKGIDWVGAGLTGLLAKDRAMLARRVAQARTADSAGVAAAEAAVADGTAHEDHAGRAPAVLAMAATDARGDARTALVAPMAAVTRATLVRQRVPGSYWASSGGCGVDIEGVEAQFMVDCGMGHVTARAQRALYFWDPADRGY